MLPASKLGSALPVQLNFPIRVPPRQVFCELVGTLSCRALKNLVYLKLLAVWRILVLLAIVVKEELSRRWVTSLLRLWGGTRRMKVRLLPVLFFSSKRESVNEVVCSGLLDQDTGHEKYWHDATP